MTDTIYLDYQASTPIDPRVQAILVKALSEDFANPHSADHHLGWLANKNVETARARIARAIGSDADEVYFTGGATEANNLGVLGAALGAPSSRRRILVGATEHKAVLEPAAAANFYGFTVEEIPVDLCGRIDVNALTEMAATDVAVISVMAVNNEIGTVQDVASIASIGAAVGAFVHCDATQAPLALPVAMGAWGVDAASFSSHKIYGPKGVGALYLSNVSPWRPKPLQYGGGQEEALRPGTLPTPLCVAFGEAFALVDAEGECERKVISRLRDDFAKSLAKHAPNLVITAFDADRHPGNLHLRFPGIVAGDLLSRLQPLIAASTGSACTSGKISASHVLAAIGLTPQEADECVRFSIGRFTNKTELDRASVIIGAAIEKARLQALN